MAEFCLDCVNKHIRRGKKQLREKDVILDIDFCEDCEEWKPCVVALKKKPLWVRYNHFKYRLCELFDKSEKWD